MSEVPFIGILASAVQPSVRLSGASLGILRLLEISSFDFRLKPFAQTPAVSQNANAVQAFGRRVILANVSSIYDVATKGSNIPKGKGVSP